VVSCGGGGWRGALSFLCRSLFCLEFFFFLLPFFSFFVWRFRFCWLLRWFSFFFFVSPSFSSIYFSFSLLFWPFYFFLPFRLCVAVFLASLLVLIFFFLWAPSPLLPLLVLFFFLVFLFVFWFFFICLACLSFPFLFLFRVLPRVLVFFLASFPGWWDLPVSAFDVCCVVWLPLFFRVPLRFFPPRFLSVFSFHLSFFSPFFSSFVPVFLFFPFVFLGLRLCFFALL